MEIRDGILSKYNFDCLLIPGGNASLILSMLGEVGKVLRRENTKVQLPSRLMFEAL